MFSLRKPRRAWREARALWGPLAPVMVALEPFAPDLYRHFRNGRMRPEGGVVYLGSSPLIHNGMSMRLPDGTVYYNDFQWSLEGMNALLSAIRGSSLSTSWYIAPYSGAYTPTETLTHATFTATATEATNYDQATRVAWAPATSAGTVSGQAVLGNTGDSDFTVSSGGMSVRGYGLMDVSTKSSTSGSGVLLGASDLLGSAVTLPAATVFGVDCSLKLDT